VGELCILFLNVYGTQLCPSSSLSSLTLGPSHLIEAHNKCKSNEKSSSFIITWIINASPHNGLFPDESLPTVRSYRSLSVIPQQNNIFKFTPSHRGGELKKRKVNSARIDHALPRMRNSAILHVRAHNGPRAYPRACVCVRARVRACPCKDKGECRRGETALGQVLALVFSSRRFVSRLRRSLAADEKIRG
jgi:hypothetical protein